MCLTPMLVNGTSGPLFTPTVCDTVRQAVPDVVHRLKQENSPPQEVDSLYAPPWLVAERPGSQASPTLFPSQSA